MPNAQRADEVALEPSWQFDWQHLRSFAIFVASIATGLSFWKLSSTFLVNPQLLPPPEKVFAAAWVTLLDGELFEIVRISLVRIGIGFCIGCAVGITCGLVMGSFRFVGEFLDPLIEVVRPISTVAMIPI